MEAQHVPDVIDPLPSPKSENVPLHVRLPPLLNAEIDRLVGRRFMTRGEAVRALLRSGLEIERDAG
jgi:Arc/MetJ-type ribon-helix-helix transcriptional regulator